MKIRIFLVMIFCLLMSANESLYLAVAEASEMEIFQKDGIKSDGEYGAEIQREAHDLMEHARNDDGLISVVKKWKDSGVTLQEVRGAINGLSVDFASYTEATPCSKLRTSISTKHDLTISGGLSAWMLEQLLGCKFPAVTASTTTETLKSIEVAARARLDEICSQPLVEEDRGKIAAVSQNNQAEKVKLASDPNTSPVALDKLSSETDEDVRRAVAQNPNAATVTLKRLSEYHRFVSHNPPPKTGEKPSQIALLSGRHPKFGPRSLYEGNYLFLREKKKEQH